MRFFCRLFLPIVLIGCLAGATWAQSEPETLPTPVDPPRVYVNRIPPEVFNVTPSTGFIQDPQGMLWITGAFAGLFKYDGYTAERVFFQTYETPVLTIVDLIQDRDGFLWLATDQGAFRYDTRTETSTRFFHNASDAHSLSHNQVHGLYEDRNGMVWVATRDGLHRYDAATGDFTIFAYLPDEPRRAFKHMLEDRQGRFWMGAWGVQLFDPTSGTYTRYLPRPDLNTPSAPENYVTACIEDRQGRLWVGTNTGTLYRFDPESGTFERHRDGAGTTGLGDAIQNIVEDPQHGLWLVTPATGLQWFDPDRGTWATYYHDPADPHSISNGLVNNVHADRQGGIWVSVHSQGLDHFDRAAGNFAHFFESPDAPEDRRFYGPGVYGIATTPDGAVWAKTVPALFRIDRQAGTVERFIPDPGNPNGLSPSASERLLTVDPTGRLWLGGDRLSGMDPDRPGFFTHYSHNPADSTSIGPGNVETLLVDAQGMLWTGHETGTLSRLDPDQPGVFTHFTLAPDAGPVYSLYKDGAGILWAGTLTMGLYRLDPQTGEVVHYGHDPQLTGMGLSSPNIDGMCEQPEAPDVLWIAAYGGGFNRLHKPTGRFSYLSVQNSDLPDDGVMGVFCDKDIWISTDNGVARYNPDTGAFTHYTTEDGLQRNFYNSSYHRSPFSGEIFLGGPNGISSFFPDEISGNPYAPEVILTSLQIYTDTVTVGEGSPLTRPLAETKTVTLKHNQNDITLGYAGLHYRNPSRNQHAYMLEPVDTDWRMAGMQRTVRFTNLEPGNYTFRVKAANSDGVWNEEGRTLAITILPPWWETGWAYGLYGLLFVAGLFAVGWLQRQRLLRKERTMMLHQEKEIAAAQAEALRSLDREKSRLFANISHEFRTPLTLILGPLEDLDEGFHGPVAEPVRKITRTAIHNGRRLLRLVNQLLDLSRLESGRLHLQAQPGDLTHFIRRLAQTFVPLAERKEINFQVELPDEPLPAYFDPEQLEKVVTNLLGNAFKFTDDGGMVRLVLTRTHDADTPGSAVLAVHDTGRGISDEDLPRVFDRFYQADASSTRRKPGTGIGLALVRELVDLHHGSIDVQSTMGEGSTFTVRLPLDNAHLSSAEIVMPEEGGFAEHISALPEDDIHVLLTDEIAITEDATFDTDATDDPDTDRTTVLVADDNAEVRAYVAQHLQHRYRVIKAVDGRDALEKTRRFLPDIVVSDVMMPEMNGYDLCRTLKEDPETDFIPVILLTAKAGIDDKIEGLEEGADDYISKPFNVRELQVRVENLIALRQRLKARFVQTGIVGITPAEESEDESLRSEDDKFLEQVRTVIKDRLDDETLNVEALASALGMGRTTLYRRLEFLEGVSPMGLAWQMRLEHAGRMLQAGVGNVSEVAYAVGFKSVAHFSRRFNEMYGMSPTAYVAGKGV